MKSVNSKNNYKNKKILLKVFLILIGVTLMGFSLSLLNLTHLGIEGFTCMNLTIANRIGMSVGNWQLILNGFLLIIVLIFDYKQIGFGTIANMVLVGYSLEFFSYVWGLYPNISTFASDKIGRFIIMVPAILIFVFAASLYMTVGMGAAPNDAVPFIIASKLHKIPFKYIRRVWDLAAIVIAFALGGEVGIITIAMAFLLGPTVTLVKNFLEQKVFS